MKFASIVFVLFSLTFLILSSSMSYAQPELNHWHFGEGIGLDFNGGDPVVEFSNTNTGLDQCPATISDEAGNLLLYCDGTNVYNADHEIVDNGTFDTPSSENLLVQDPGSEVRYFLFRSFAGEVNYSVVDITLDDGNGGIAPEDKDIAFHTEESELVSAVNDSGSIVWIITADNDPDVPGDIIHLNIYALTSIGLELTGEVDEEFFFAGWNTTLDDARISPDCSRIAISYKGHYICMMRFDNTLGEIYDIMYDELDTGASFANVTEIEFSPNSIFMYALGDFNTIRQYNLTAWNLQEIIGSFQIIQQGDINSNWTDLKLAQNGKIYIANTAAGALDVINTPDLPGAAANYQAGAISIPEGLTTYFPNTPNIICQEPTFSASIQHQYVCSGDSTMFWYFSTETTDSVAWDFDDPDSGDDNFSSDETVYHQFTAPGTYDVTLTCYVGGETSMWNEVTTVYEQPVVDLGDDIELEDMGSITLHSGYPDMDNLWSNGEMTESIFVETAGEYWVVVDNNGCSDSDTVNVEILITDVPGQSNELSLMAFGNGQYGVVGGQILDIRAYDDLGRLLARERGSGIDLSEFLNRRVHLVARLEGKMAQYTIMVQ